MARGGREQSDVQSLEFHSVGKEVGVPRNVRACLVGALNEGIRGCGM